MMPVEGYALGGRAAARSRARPRWPDRVGHAAAAWSAGYGTLGVHWWAGGAGFPFGTLHDPWAHLSLLRGAHADVAAPLIAMLGALGAVVGVACARGRNRPLARVPLLIVAWTFAVALAVVIPDARVLATTAYAPLLVGRALLGWPADERVLVARSWPIVNQFVCVGGGLLWAAAAVAYQRRLRQACRHCGRAAHRAHWTTPAAAVRWGRWAVAVAAAIPPMYAASRVAWAFGIPLGSDAAHLRAVRMAEGGGRRVPIALAVVPASVASAIVLTGGLTILRLWLTGAFAVERATWIGSAPMLLWMVWGLALAAATLAYYYRRRGPCPHCQRA